MKTCSVCKREVDSLSAAVVRGKYIGERCSRCIETAKSHADYAAKYQRDRMRKDHERDLVQRWAGDTPNPEIAKAWPDVAKQQFGEDFMRTNG